jgi:hypothetical protein
VREPEPKSIPQPERLLRQLYAIDPVANANTIILS